MQNHNIDNSYKWIITNVYGLGTMEIILILCPNIDVHLERRMHAIFKIGHFDCS